MNICFSGLGGQGIVLLGVALGEAAAREGLNALQTQSYGAEARGGACYSTVIISKDAINDIAPEELDMLAAMSQAAYDKFSNSLKGDGILIFESDLVKPTVHTGAGIPATALAKKHLGKELFANMVMFGYFVKVSRSVSREKATEAIEASVPPKFLESNLKAFQLGFEYAP